MSLAEQWPHAADTVAPVALSDRQFLNVSICLEGGYLLLLGAAVVAAVAGNEGLMGWLLVGVALMSLTQNFTGRRRLQIAHEMGRVEERLETIASLQEAVQRGLSPSEWAQSYIEKIQVDYAEYGDKD